VDYAAPPTTKKIASHVRKKGRHVKKSRRTFLESKSCRVGNDVRVGTTASRHLDAHPAAPNKASESFKHTARGTGTLSIPSGMKDAARRVLLWRHPVRCPGL
jgi:hypothetical protein